MSWFVIYFLIGMAISLAWGGYKWYKEEAQVKRDAQERADRQYEEWK